jgi:hypothetical protein
MKGIFNEYIDHWTEVKIEATKSGNKEWELLLNLCLIVYMVSLQQV